MKTLAPSFRALARVAAGTILLAGACAGKGGGGSPTSGSGGSSTGGSPTGPGAGGSGTGGAAGAPGSGGGGTGGDVGTGGSSTGGAQGSGTGGGQAGSSGAGGQPGTGGAGQGGASGGAAGASGGGSGHCGARAGLLFCDDFEKDAPGAPPAPWTTSIIGSGTVTIDGTDPAASGTKSVHVQDGDSDYDTLLALHDTTILPSTTGKLYLRFYIRLAAAMTAGHNSFVLGDLFANVSSGGDAGSLRFSEDNQMFAESIGGDAQGAMSNNNFYNDHQIGPGLTAGQWACVELLLDHATPEIDVWLNGTEIPDLESTAWAIDAYDYLRFGFEKYAGPGSEIWYDDIALGTQPIGCN